MRIQKIIKAYEDHDIEITEVTIPSVEEVENLPREMRARVLWWWLRSPSEDISYYADRVCEGGEVCDCYVGDHTGGVCPTLRIRNLQSAHLAIGDKILIAGHEWTVIGNDLVLCDDIVGRCAFREGWLEKDASIYEKSDLKKWVEAWARENEIMEGTG